MSLLTAFELSPSTLACRAAIELDNLILDRISDFKAIPLLIQNLNRIDMLTRSSLDPGEAFVLNQAISNSSMFTVPIITTDELLKNASDIRNRLEQVISNPEDYKTKTEELVKLRVFCLELSKSALSFTRTLDEMEPKHPFRR